MYDDKTLRLLEATIYLSTNLRSSQIAIFHMNLGHYWYVRTEAMYYCTDIEIKA
jgi:hypothetical protein